MIYKTLHKKLKRQYSDLQNTTQETRDNTMTYKTLHKKLKRQYNDLQNTTQETKETIQ